MIDWRQIAWTGLPGPSGFVRGVVNDALGSPQGVSGLWLPAVRRPDGLIDCIRQEMIDRGRFVLAVDAGQGDQNAPPAVLLADAAGCRLAARNVAGFLAEPRLADHVFIVDGLPEHRWTAWALFLKAVRAEAERTPRLRAPRLLVLLPQWLPPPDFAATVGGPLRRWLGQTSRTDATLLVEQTLGGGDGSPASRTALSVVVETAGWDEVMLREMSGWDQEEQIQPFLRLSAMVSADAEAVPYPSWDNGLADEWDGDVHVHPLALLRHFGGDALLKRIWKGQVRTLFPFLIDLRLRFVTKYRDYILASLPLKTDTKVFHTVEDLEIGQLRFLLGRIVPRPEKELLVAGHEIRKALAHQEPASASLVLALSEAWEESRDLLQQPFVGWSWARRNQRLTLMVGPSGAGKTTLAERTFRKEEIVSSDAIRVELSGQEGVRISQATVFREVHRRAVARLSAGRSTTIDATNIRTPDRLACAMLAPSDVQVAYMVVDRSLERKLETAGDRNPDVVREHDATFAASRGAALRGDDLPNVEVISMVEQEIVDA